MNRGDRVEIPTSLPARDSALGTRPSALGGPARRPLDWEAALAELRALVEAARGLLVVLASGRASTESLGWVRRLVGDGAVTAAIKVPLGEEAPLAGVPNLALRRERTPNLHGARLVGYDADWDQAVGAARRTELVVLLDAELDDAEVAAVLAARTVVSIGTVDDDRLHSVRLILPTTTMAEENGTYVNRDGRVQRFHQAKPAPALARPAWWIAAEAMPALDHRPASAEEAFAGLGAWVPALAGLTYADLGHVGRPVPLVPASAAR
jgi:NADH dehydrogenase/NADH:ubiquinone oxidoreductase subunit G